MKGFDDVFVDNDEKVASSKKPTQFKTGVKKSHTPFEKKMTEIFMAKTAQKPYSLRLHILI